MRVVVIASALVVAIGVAALTTFLSEPGKEAPAPRRVRPEPRADGDPNPAFIERQQTFTRAVLTQEDSARAVADLRRLLPFSAYEQRRLIGLLTTYRSGEARRIVSSLLDSVPELREGYMDRWLQHER